MLTKDEFGRYLKPLGNSRLIFVGENMKRILSVCTAIILAINGVGMPIVGIAQAKTSDSDVQLSWQDTGPLAVSTPVELVNDDDEPIRPTTTPTPPPAPPPTPTPEAPDQLLADETVTLPDNDSAQTAVFFLGRFSVSRPAEESIRSIQTQVWRARPISTTAPGIAFRADVTARDGAGNIMHEFGHPITLTLNTDGLFNPLEAQAHFSAWAGYSNTLTGNWEAITVTAVTSNSIIALTNHLSVFGFGTTGIVNGSWTPSWREGQADYFSGGYTWGYDFALPSGPGGTGPRPLRLTYSSRSVDGILSWAQSDGVGTGWHLDPPEISYRNIFRNAGGNTHDDVFLLVIDGATYRLIPTISTITETLYKTEDDQFYKIASHYGFWELWQKDGTRLVFGMDDSNVQIPIQNDGSSTLSTVRWRLKYIDYPWLDGSQDVVYSYTRETYGDQCRAWSDAGLISSSFDCWGGYTSSAIRSSYVTTITWPGARVVFGWRPRWENGFGPFDPENGLGAQAWRSDFGNSGWAVFWQNKAVEKIYLDAQKPDNSYLNLRRWELGYGTINPTDNTSKALRVLTSIQEFAPNNTVLPKTTFEYVQHNNKQWKDVPPENTEWNKSQFYYPRLSQIKNGYGGQSDLTYEATDTGDGQTSINHRLKWMTASDGLGGGTRVEYSYSDWSGGKCYFAGSDATTCISASGGNFVGHRDMQAVEHDWANTIILRRTYNSFYLPSGSSAPQTGDAYPLRGKPKVTQVIDGQTNAIYQTTTNTWGYTWTYPTTAYFSFLKQTETSRDSVTLLTEHRYDCEEISPCYGNPTRLIEYGSTSAAGDERSTVYSYYPNAGPSWFVGLLAQQQIYSGVITETPLSVNLAAQSRNLYDGASSYTSPPTKGLLTKVENGIAAPYLSEAYGYDAWGNRVVITDANGNTARRGFDSIFHVYPLTETNPAEQTTQYFYYGINGSASQTGNGLTGQVEKVVDVNGNATTARYEWHGRPVKIIQAGDSDSAPTQFYVYGDDGLNAVTPPLKIQTQKLLQAGCPTCVFTSQSYFDGLGRTRQSIRQDVGGYVATSSAFDDLGRTNRVSVPYPVPVSNYSAPSWVSITQTITLFDVLNRTTVITATDGLTSEQRYGSGNGLLRMRFVDANRHTRVEAADGQGRLAVVEEYTGTYPLTHTLYATTRYGYDPLNNLRLVTDTVGNTTVITYDSVGRKTGMQDPDMGIWGYTYDANGNLLSQTDAKGNILTFEYDKLSRLTGKYLGATRLAGYAYDVARVGRSNLGQRGVMWNAEDATTFDYDERGRLGATSKSVGQNVSVYEAESAPYGHGCGTSGGAAWLSPAVTGGSACHMSSGPYQSPQTAGPRQTAIFRLAIDVVDGQQDTVATIDVRDASTASILATRDLKRGEFKGGIGNFSEFALEFDTTGRGSNPLEYRVLWMNRANMAHDKTILVWNSQPYQTDYTYDSADRMVTMKYPQTQNGREMVNVTYNAAMQPQSQVGAYSYVSNMSYNALGQPARIDFGNGLNTQYRYWGVTFTQTGLATNTFYGRLRGICVNSYGSGVACADGDASANVRMNMAYAYDKVGNISNMGDRTRSEGLAFTYDELDRLLSFSIGGVSNETYTYDKIGNITGKGGAVYSYQDSKPHAVTHINGLRVASYDNNGNMTTRTESATYTQKFDVENRLTDVNGVHFAYDADGALIKKVEGSKTTTYIGNYFERELAAVFVPSTMRSYGSQWKLDNVALPGGKTRKYYYFGGQRVAVRENDGVPQWIHGDHLGSASVTTDNNGAKAGEERYKPFGGSRVDSGDVKGNKRFQGSERVNSIELDSMGARFYSAGLGRFISADIAIPGRSNPQTWNRYSFVLNNPLGLLDKQGHCPTPPSSLGPTICFALFIKPETISVVPGLVVHGDGRDFAESSPTQASRAFVWIPVNNLSNSQYGINSTGYPVGDEIKWADPSQENKINISMLPDNVIHVDYDVVIAGFLEDKAPHLNGSVDFIPKTDGTGYISRGTRDGFPWVEAYYHNGKGNVSTIFQRPALRSSPFDLFAIEDNSFVKVNQSMLQGRKLAPRYDFRIAHNFAALIQSLFFPAQADQWDDCIHVASGKC